MRVGLFRRHAMYGLLASALGACARPAPAPQPAPDAASDAALPASHDAKVDHAVRLPPLAGDWVERWTLPSGATVFVTRPLGASGPRPVVVGVHGAEDRADWACSEWHGAVGGYAWVLCPQGVPLRAAYAWGSSESSAQLAFEARDELRARSGAYVAEGPLLYAGFSQGASLASSVVAAHPGEFNRVVMVEAGHTPLSSPAVIFGLAKGKVGRALLSCSTGGCATFSTDLALAAKRSAFELLTNDAGRRGHVFDGVVIKSLGEAMVKLVAGDPRYDGFADAIRAR